MANKYRCYTGMNWTFPCCFVVSVLLVVFLDICVVCVFVIVFICLLFCFSSFIYFPCLWTVNYWMTFRFSLRLFNSCVNLLCCASLRLLYHSTETIFGSFFFGLLLKYWRCWSTLKIWVLLPNWSRQLTTEIPSGIPHNTISHVIIFSKLPILNTTHLSQNISQFVFFKDFFETQTVYWTSSCFTITKEAHGSSRRGPCLFRNSFV